MNDLPFIDYESQSRTQFSDECYRALGRALYVAQHFEANCKSLVTLLDIKSSVDSYDDPEFTKLIEKLWNRSLGNNIGTLKMYGIPEDVYSVLNKAKEGRNHIAHEVTLGVEHKIEQDLGRKEILHEIAGAIRDIAEGDKIIGLLIQSATNEPRPSSSYLHDYANKIVGWVCGTSD